MQTDSYNVFGLFEMRQRRAKSDIVIKTQTIIIKQNQTIIIKAESDYYHQTESDYYHQTVSKSEENKVVFYLNNICVKIIIIMVTSQMAPYSIHSALLLTKALWTLVKSKAPSRE